MPRGGGDASNGFSWQSKKRKKIKSQHQTPGSTKGGSCVATPLQKMMAKRNRSWKHAGYSDWLRQKNGDK